MDTSRMSKILLPFSGRPGMAGYRSVTVLLQILYYLIPNEFKYCFVLVLLHVLLFDVSRPS